jgi:predicted DNA-binding helix-hairpin-helix protein
MHLESDGEQDCQPVIGGKQLEGIPISEAVAPGGRRVKLLKTLLTSACERDCYYCPFRAGRDMRRATFKPDEMAKTFVALEKGGAVEGLFLSSGITGGGVRTQDKLLDTADILRNRYGYKGYLHLKIMPGSEKDQVLRAMQLASRLSVNLEAPNTERLSKLAPHKQFTEELVQPLKWAEQIRQTQPAYQTWNGRWPSTTTQFVVGAAGESDLELLQTAEYLYTRASLQRAYFSAFRPISDTPLEHLPAEDKRREHRLYQSSFLIRDYGFELEDMPFSQGGNLPLTIDPKTAWAQANLAQDPVELNRASRKRLMRIPGIGPKRAAQIIQARYQNKLRESGDLRRLGIQVQRAAPYILLDGSRPAFQPALF